MTKMVDSGAVDNKLFSFSIAADNTTQSQVTFGGYDTDKFATGNLTWVDAKNNSLWWTLTLDQMSFSVDTYSNELDSFTRDPPYEATFGKKAEIIVDTGTSYVYLPETDMENFITILEYKAGIVCELYDDEIPICTCGSSKEQNNFPDLTFTI